MRILILGGTIFLGRHLAETAVARGHELTLFHRGKTAPDAFPELEHLLGDRDGDLDVLRGRSWDAVIDTSGYLPSTVRRAAQLLTSSAGHYTFFSSTSVYASPPSPGIDEDGPLATMSDDELAAAERVEPEKRATSPELQALYGALKVRCETAAREAMPGRVLLIRPGQIVGPHDYSGRFTYWVERVARGGKILAPGRPEQRLELIDARDLAEWTIRKIESGTTGIFNAVGQADGVTMGEILDACRLASGSDAAWTWVDEEFLLAQQVQPWTEIPLWAPEAYSSFFQIRNDKAIAAGLEFRDLAVTARDTLGWTTEAPGVSSELAFLTPEREAELLRRFRTT